MNSIRHIEPPMNNRIEAYPRIALALKNILLFLYSASTPLYLRSSISASSFARTEWAKELTMKPAISKTSTARKHDHAAMRRAV